MIQTNRLNSVLEQTLVPLATLSGPHHTFTFINSRFRESLLGGRDVTGLNFAEALNETIEQGFLDILDQVFRSGQPYQGKEISVILIQPGPVARRFVLNFTFSPMRDSARVVEGILLTAVDVTESVRTREHMRDSRERYRVLTNLSPQIVWEGRSDGYVSFFNQYWSDYTGLSFGESGGSGWLNAVHPDHREQAGKSWLETAAKKEFSEAEFPIRRHDGAYRWHLSKAQPILDSTGQIERWVGVVTDIHDQRVETSRLQSVLDTIPIFTGVINSHGELNMINEAALKAVNSTRAETIGKPLWECPWWQSVPGMEDRLRTAIARAFAGHSVRFDTPYSAWVDGSWQTRFVDFAVVPIIAADGSINDVTATGFEITARIEQNFKLEAATKSAELANHTKSAFLANMSHEIRTPLGAIIGFADLLRERDLAPDDRQQFLETIVRNGRALTRIIDDILDLAKVESGKLEVEQVEFPFIDLINDVMDVFRERTRAKGLYLRANVHRSTPARIISDPTRLRQILINIVGNAVKFTSSGGVTLDVRQLHASEIGAEYEIVVRDTGVGISEAQRDRLFQPFVQADNSTTRKFGGTGLGLALSRRLANALGGNLSIEDCTPGAGAAFVISFRAKLAAVQSKMAVPDRVTRTSDSLNGVKVLLADDSEDNQYLVERLLKINGAMVDTVGNGLEAFRQGLTGSYDVVLMDMQMPQMDGYESTRALREAGFKRPIIALTAHAMAEERARSFAAGCTSYLTKPLNVNDLLATVRRLAEAR